MNKNLTEIIRNLVIKFVNEKHYIPNEKENEYYGVRRIMNKKL